MGIALNWVGDLKAAVKFLKKWQDRYPDDFWLNLQLGLYLQKMPQPGPQDAIRYLGAAVALNKTNPKAYNALGCAYYLGARLDESIAAHRQAIGLDPDGKIAWLRYDLGMSLRWKGRLDEAVAAFREATRLDDEDSAPHCELGEALLLQGRLQEARESL